MVGKCVKDQPGDNQILCGCGAQCSNDVFVQRRGGCLAGCSHTDVKKMVAGWLLNLAILHKMLAKLKQVDLAELNFFESSQGHHRLFPIIWHSRAGYTTFVRVWSIAREGDRGLVLFHYSPPVCQRAYQTAAHLVHAER
jgi:hypothetical protein